MCWAACRPAVQDVRGERLLRLDQRLRQVLGVGLADTNVIAILNENLGQRKGKTIDLVEVTLQEQHAAGLVADRHAIGEFRRSTKAVKHRLFMVIAGNALLLTEDHLPFVRTLIINTIKNFVQDGLNYRPKVGTTHRSSHSSSLP